MFLYHFPSVKFSLYLLILTSCVNVSYAILLQYSLLRPLKRTQMIKFFFLLPNITTMKHLWQLSTYRETRTVTNKCYILFSLNLFNWTWLDLSFFWSFWVLWVFTGSCPNLPQRIQRRYVSEVFQFWEYFYIILLGYKTTWSKYFSTKNAIGATLSYDIFSIIENSKATCFQKIMHYQFFLYVLHHLFLIF